MAQVLATEERCDALILAADVDGEATLASARARVAELEVEAPALLERRLAELEAEALAAREKLTADTVARFEARVTRYDGVDDSAVARLGEWVARAAAGIETRGPASFLAGGDA